MATWQCIKGCGACCNLDPRDRPDLAEYLSPEELTHYLSLVGEGGWCINFDAEARDCRIYDERPRFCRVLPEIFEQMFGVSLEEFNDFAIDCCDQQIAGVYGEDSPELERYEQAIA
jgi:Fe-S-cluster containining protein